MLPDLPKTWLVVPCYNEAKRLPVEHFRSFLRRWPLVRLCLVNDGSRDETEDVLRRLAESCGGQAVVLSLEKNCGKAEAVRRGVLHATSLGDSQYVGYWDADLATPLEELPRFFTAAGEYARADALCGCRLRRLGASVDRLWHRHLLGRVFATLASLILRIPVYDTQCGAKLFRTSLARQVFAQPFITSWVFDVELLARIVAVEGIAHAGDCIVEIPLLRWSDVGGSKLRLRHYFTALMDLWRIFRHYPATPASVPGQGLPPTALLDPVATQGDQPEAVPEERRKAA